MQGELYLARRSRPVTAPAPLPPELQEVIDHPLANIRAGACRSSRAWSGGGTPGWRWPPSWPSNALPTTTTARWRQRQRRLSWPSTRITARPRSTCRRRCQPLLVSSMVRTSVAEAQPDEPQTVRSAEALACPLRNALPPAATVTSTI